VYRGGQGDTRGSVGKQPRGMQQSAREHGRVQGSVAEHEGAQQSMREHGRAQGSAAEHKGVWQSASERNSSGEDWEV
jgi:hypothetical protein